MTEPSGGFNASEANMPWDVACGSRFMHGPINMNEMAKSRLKRWILRDTP